MKIISYERNRSSRNSRVKKRKQAAEATAHQPSTRQEAQKMIEDAKNADLQEHIITSAREEADRIKKSHKLIFKMKKSKRF